jgi:ACS family hexuronate transporter-like MFS transporter
MNSPVATEATPRQNTPQPPVRSGFKIPNIRWIIAGLLLFAAVKNYIDRQLMSILAPTIQHDLNISDTQYADVLNYFMIAYTFSYVMSGRVVDWIGTRLSLALFVAWWSASNALTAFARSVGSLSCFRFMLGLGEAGCWTSSPKAVSEWFPARERGLAVGLYSMGGPLGAIIASLLALGIGTHYKWQTAFLLTGLLGVAWVIPWLWIYRKPGEHPNLTDGERAVLAEVIADSNAALNAPKEPELKLWGEVMRQPAVWLLLVGRLLTDPVWYFFQFWMAKYLNTEYGLDTKRLSIMWTIFLTADLGFLVAGFLAGRLIKRGSAAPAARLWVMAASACLVPLSCFVPLAHGLWLTMAVSMLVVMASTAYLSNLSALVVDIIPTRILGTSFGLIAAGSTLGAMAMNWGVAYLIKNYSYAHCFYAMALLHPVATLILWRLRRAKAY